MLDAVPNLQAGRKDLLIVSVSGNHGNSGCPVISLLTGRVAGMIVQYVPAPLLSVDRVPSAGYSTTIRVYGGGSRTMDHSNVDSSWGCQYCHCAEGASRDVGERFFTPRIVTRSTSYVYGWLSQHPHSTYWPRLKKPVDYDSCAGGRGAPFPHHRKQNGGGEDEEGEAVRSHRVYYPTAGGIGFVVRGFVAPRFLAPPEERLRSE